MTVTWHDQETANQKTCSYYDHNYPITNDLLYPRKTAGFRRFQTHAFVLSGADCQHRTLDCQGLSATQASDYLCFPTKTLVLVNVPQSQIIATNFNLDPKKTLCTELHNFL